MPRDDHKSALAHRIAERLAARTAEGQVMPRGLATRALPVPAHAHPWSLAEHDAIERVDTEELIIDVQCGCRLLSLAAALRASGLLFPPIQLAGVLERLGLAGASCGTIGGLYNDPRELPTWPKWGPLKDHVLGIEAVRGDGVVFRAGGRVVKNVTGYDLPRFLCGSRGRFAVLVRSFWRLVRAPEAYAWARFVFDSEAHLWHAVARLREAGSDPLLCFVSIMPRYELTWIDCGRSAVVARLTERTLARVDASLDVPITVVDHDELDASITTIAPLPIAAPPRWRIRLAASRWAEWRSRAGDGATTLPSIVFPFAHFGLGECVDDDVDDARRELAAFGGSLTLENAPSEVDRDGPLPTWRRDPFDRNPDESALTTALLAQWDPDRRLHRDDFADPPQ